MPARINRSMSGRRLRSAAVLLALAAAGCSLALDFGPEGLPCITDGDCYGGTRCDDGSCSATAGGGGSDDGLTPAAHEDPPPEQAICEKDWRGQRCTAPLACACSQEDPAVGVCVDPARLGPLRCYRDRWRDGNASGDPADEKGRCTLPCQIGVPRHWCSCPETLYGSNIRCQGYSGNASEERPLCTPTGGFAALEEWPYPCETDSDCAAATARR